MDSTTPSLAVGYLSTRAAIKNYRCQITRRGTPILRPVVDDVIAQMQRLHVDALIVDPFVSCHRVGENDNSAMDMVAKEWGRVADRGDCAVELIHHTRKAYDGGNEVTTESPGAPRR